MRAVKRKAKIRAGETGKGEKGSYNDMFIAQLLVSYATLTAFPSSLGSSGWSHSINFITCLPPSGNSQGN